MQKETLYIVASPIGNLQDITFRALEVIKCCDLLVCEDTRVTNKLLAHFNITDKRLFSYANHNLKAATSRIISYLKNQFTVALVSDAGTPLISDPGEQLVAACYQNNIKVTSIPGPSSIISALVISGFTPLPFYFGGFLPSKTKDKQEALLVAKSIKGTLIFFESKYRLLTSLLAIAEIFGENVEVALVRELTKIYEEVRKGAIRELIASVTDNPPLGEIIILVDNNISKVSSLTEADLIKIIEKEINNKASVKELTHKLSTLYNFSKTEIYNLAIKVKNGKK